MTSLTVDTSLLCKIITLSGENEDKVYIKILCLKGLWNKKFYQRVQEQKKMESVTFQDAVDREPLPWIANPTDSDKSV